MRKAFEYFVLPASISDVQCDTANGFTVFRSDGSAEVQTQQAVTRTGTEKGKSRVTTCSSKPLKSASIFFWMSDFLFSGVLISNGLTTDDDRGVIVEVYVTGDADLLDAYPTRCPFSLAILQDTGVFAIC